jgi:hypothetical protein
VAPFLDFPAQRLMTAPAVFRASPEMSSVLPAISSGTRGKRGVVGVPLLGVAEACAPAFERMRMRRAKTGRVQKGSVLAGEARRDRNKDIRSSALRAAHKGGHRNILLFYFWDFLDC